MNYIRFIWLGAGFNNFEYIDVKFDNDFNCAQDQAISEYCEITGYSQSVAKSSIYGFEMLNKMGNIDETTSMD